MANKTSLFGRPIIPGLRVTQIEQLHDILLEEIQRGRWKVGERMPSVSDLVEMSGLSRGSVQRAFEMLREEGYVSQEHRKGTFLASILPEGRSSLGTIGIVMCGYTPDAAGLWDHYPSRLHHVIQEATKRNYTTEVISPIEKTDWESIDSVNGPFGHRVKGIISIHPFPRRYKQDLSPDDIPIVFVGDSRPNSTPCVAPDHQEGFQRLTNRAIEAGHRNIVFFHGQPFPHEEKLHALLGYEEAMQNAGLEINYKAIDLSTTDQPPEASIIREFLEAFPDATAVVCSRVRPAQILITTADILGIRIPQYLSVLARGSQPMRIQNGEELLTGLDLRLPQIVERAFDLLIQQIHTHKCLDTRIFLAPGLCEGNSLAVPRSERELQEAKSALS